MEIIAGPYRLEKYPGKSISLPLLAHDRFKRRARGYGKIVSRSFRRKREGERVVRREWIEKIEIHRKWGGSEGWSKVERGGGGKKQK